ncbi:hypothetical protein PA01_06535 [Azoarcus sp. PA01]|nr:hypothetical protein PA01_06535 [Azoarcus sp. PA01]
MNSLRGALGAALACVAQAAGAADPAECRHIDEDAARLACYDEAFRSAPTEVGAEQYTAVDFRELWVNLSGHRGKKVEVEGEISTLAEPGLVSLGKRLPSANTIQVKTDQLDRALRLRILEACNRSCAVIVKGVVSTRGQNHILADDIVFKKALTPQERREQGRR